MDETPWAGLPAEVLLGLGPLIDTLPTAIWFKSPAGVFLYANQACEMFYGVPRNFLLGRTDLDLAAVDNPIRAQRMDDDARERPDMSVDDQLFRPTAMLGIRARVTRMPRFAGGCFIGLVGSISVADDSSQATRAELMVANQVSRVARAVRDPAAGIGELVRRLQDSSLPERDLEMVKAIGSSADLVQSISANLIDFGMARCGTLRVASAVFRVADLLDDVLDTARPRALAKDLQLELHTEGLSELTWFNSDAARLRQVLLNLLTNAIRHTAQGKVSLMCRCSGTSLVRPDAVARVEVAVQDTGEGIPPPQQAELFTPYMRRSMPKPGTGTGTGIGLGLIVSREVVRALGGDMAFESTPGKGSRFSFFVVDTF